MLNVNLAEKTLLCMRSTKRSNGWNNREVAEVYGQMGGIIKKMLRRSNSHKQ